MHLILFRRPYTVTQTIINTGSFWMIQMELERHFFTQLYYIPYMAREFLSWHPQVL